MARYQNPLAVTRHDVPFVVMTLVFLAAIFLAGRYSVTVPEPVAVPVPVQAAPVASTTRIVVVTTSAPVEPPMALLPEFEETPASIAPKMAAPKPSTTVAVTPVATPAKPVEPIVLEETPENPYRAKRASNNPGF